MDIVRAWAGLDVAWAGIVRAWAGLDWAALDVACPEE